MLINTVTPSKLPRLPSEYQEVEYIESSGTQYIDSGIPGSNGYIAEAKFLFTDLGGTSDDKYILGSAGNYPSYVFYIGKQGYGGVHRFAQAVDNTWLNPSTPTVSTNTEYIVKSTMLTSGNSLIVNGSTIGTSSYTSSYSNGYNLGIMGGIGINGGFGYVKGKLYYLKIRQGSESNIVRDFVPCYRKSDGEIGLYDLVNDVFYTNAGTGTFTKGPDVN